MEEETTWIASIDIGSKNFAFYVEEVNVKNLKSIKNIPQNKRYNENGTPTEEMNDILNSIFKDGKTILHENVDLTDKVEEKDSSKQDKKYFDQNILHNLTNMLDKHSHVWDKCSIFLVEQQMSFGKKINLKAIKIGQHTQSYFLFRYGKFKKVIEFPSYNKTCILGSEKVEKGKTKAGKIKYRNIDKPQRKKWTVVKAKEIFTIRGETEHILFSSKRGIKKDDLADVVCQLAAFKYLFFIEKLF